MKVQEDIEILAGVIQWWDRQSFAGAGPNPFLTKNQSKNRPGKAFMPKKKPLISHVGAVLKDGKKVQDAARVEYRTIDKPKRGKSRKPR